MAPALAHETGARYAILAMPGVPARRLAAIVERHLWNFHHVLIVPDLAGISSLEVVTRDLGGTIGVAVSHRLLFRAPRLFKRVFDLTFATLGGVVLLPLFGLLWALVRITSPGPGFYASPRIGERGQPFRAWKFRTMRMGGNDVLRPEHLSELARERKLRLDPRVTRIGKWLRRMSLDELPQLWNVIRGEMSLVGPRPILEDEAERYGSRYLLYKRVRPGLTGMWQVSGRNNTTYEQRLKCVEYYVRNWSVWLDLYILGKTVKVVLTGEGAF